MPIYHNFVTRPIYRLSARYKSKGNTTPFNSWEDILTNLHDVLHRIEILYCRADKIMAVSVEVGFLVSYAYRLNQASIYLYILNTLNCSSIKKVLCHFIEVVAKSYISCSRTFSNEPISFVIFQYVQRYLWRSQHVKRVRKQLKNLMLSRESVTWHSSLRH